MVHESFPPYGFIVAPGPPCVVIPAEETIE